MKARADATGPRRLLAPPDSLPRRGVTGCALPGRAEIPAARETPAATFVVIGGPPSPGRRRPGGAESPGTTGDYPRAGLSATSAAGPSATPVPPPGTTGDYPPPALPGTTRPRRYGGYPPPGTTGTTRPPPRPKRPRPAPGQAARRADPTARPWWSRPGSSSETATTTARSPSTGWPPPRAPTLEAAREAAYQTGRCYLELGDPAAALAPLELSAGGRACRGPARPHPLRHGASSRRAGRCARAAIDLYERYLEENPSIAGYVRRLIAEDHLLLGDLSSAARQFELALGEELPASLRAGAMEKLAEIGLSQGDYATAVRWYDEILAMAQYRDYRSRILYQAGQAHESAGQVELALERYNEAIDSYPDTYHAYLSLEALLALGGSVDDFTRGMVDYHNEIYEGAIAAFERHIAASGAAAGSAPWYYTGLSQAGLGRYGEALQSLDRVVRGSPDDPYFGQAWLAAARVRGWSGDAQGAVDAYRAFASSYPANAWADDGLWEGAQLLERSLWLGDAAQLYRELQGSYPDGEYATRALFQSGLCSYRIGAYDEAREAWEALEAGYAWSDWMVPSLLWQAKARLSEGDGASAEPLLARALEADPHGFYGYRSLDLMGDAPKAEEPLSLSPGDQGEERVEFERWLAGWADADAPASSGTLLADPDLAKGLELWEVGMRAQAGLHFRAARDRYRHDVASLDELCQMMLKAGAYDVAISCGELILALSPADSVFEAPAWLRRVVYPTAFADLVVPEAEARGIDPFVFMAMIRQESRFNPFATSSADARGLTQVIPDTAHYIAAKTGKAHITASDMYRPIMSVEFGLYYLAEQLDRFDGDLFAALAAYNGGPGNAQRWRDADPDMFVQNVSYSETKTYVQVVYEQYRRYQELYALP